MPVPNDASLMRSSRKAGLDGLPASNRIGEAGGNDFRREIDCILNSKVLSRSKKSS